MSFSLIITRWHPIILVLDAFGRHESIVCGYWGRHILVTRLAFAAEQIIDVAGWHLGGLLAVSAAAVGEPVLDLKLGDASTLSQLLFLLLAGVGMLVMLLVPGRQHGNSVWVQRTGWWWWWRSRLPDAGGIHGDSVRELLEAESLESLGMDGAVKRECVEGAHTLVGHPLLDLREGDAALCCHLVDFCIGGVRVIKVPLIPLLHQVHGRRVQWLALFLVVRVLTRWRVCHISRHIRVTSAAPWWWGAASTVRTGCCRWGFTVHRSRTPWVFVDAAGLPDWWLTVRWYDGIHGDVVSALVELQAVPDSADEL